MSMKIRKYLEVKLLVALKQATLLHVDLKASKNKLSLDSNLLKRAFATKSIFGNKPFNLTLASKFLSSNDK
ncbi:hypothetical protein HU811_08475 [Pseudomonas sp. SWRI196]|uniref:Uncharacterized protein n=1 Tax=Pseudomonas tehranensis TaxID=2745502 RepID=A0ABR6UR48_9PSED|nr:hypothetical protein [Pseudomonas tehranensis]MBC3346665.1 hypothetical protein [Pseudomonas tehranensis]